MSADRLRHWVLGEFDDSAAMLKATSTLRDEKAGELDTYSAYPVHGIEEALGLPRSKITWVAFTGGTLGVLVGYGIQLYWNVFTTPHGWSMNIANKPPHSPPVYIPVVFELMVLLASLSIVFGLIAWFWRFPRPHHPVFEHEAFVKTASTSGWWVSVTLDAKEPIAAVQARLGELGAKNVAVVDEVIES